MEETTILNTFGLFAWLHLQFLLFHFVLYLMFWPTGPGKFLSTLKESL